MSSFAISVIRARSLPSAFWNPAMPDPIRNRVKAHRRVWAGDLVPHEWNYRLHPEAQKAALEAQPAPEAMMGPEQFLVLATCRDEPQQVELLRRLSGEGLECRALLG
jgi:hypothetical protein